MADVSCVILTLGDRPDELARACTSVTAQSGVDVQLVVVVNGGEKEATVEGATVVRTPENVGIPAGRNEGVAHCTGDVVLFLDDDGFYSSTDLAARTHKAFAEDPALGIVSYRIVDPDRSGRQRRHVPRLRAGDPSRSSDVTTFLGGACAIRRSLLEQLGGLPAEFFYAHEETDFAWRALDAGYRIRYDASGVICHPALPPTTNPAFVYLNGRNRAWLARRNLPRPVAVLYLTNWVLLTVLRSRSWKLLTAWVRGLRHGLSAPAGVRHPMRWRTVWLMTRLGRPPII